MAASNTSKPELKIKLQKAVVLFEPSFKETFASLPYFVALEREAIVIGR